MNTQQDFTLLDILNLISIGLQFKNQSEIATITDIQADAKKIVDIIQDHLERQDHKLDEIIEVLKNENDTKSG